VTEAGGEGGEAPRRLPWRVAEVVEVVPETPRVVTLVLDVPGWPGHLPGQHVALRLTGEDGYQAQRLYSIASAPEAARLALTVERLPMGEVSPYLAGEVRAGDRFELRGPIGGHFVWTADRGGPLFLVAGGSGVVPLMAMLRHRAAVESRVPAVLLCSSRAAEEVVYRDELERLASANDGLRVVHTLTRSRPPAWTGYTRRIDRAMLAGVGFPPRERPLVYVCGPSGFVEAAGGMLLEIGHESDRIRTERFGPSGG
jgi:ferredoxin-NADP reductase